MSMNEPSSEFLASQPLPEIGSFGDFIGREKQLLEVDERLQAHRLATLVGPGGMGKTRLALEFVKRKKGDTTYGAAITFVSFELVTENSEAAVLDALVSGMKLIPSGGEGLPAKGSAHTPRNHGWLRYDYHVVFFLNVMAT